MSAERPRRVAVIGTSGSGKSLFAGALATRLGVPHVELDALFWLPDWQAPDLDAFRAKVEAATSGEGWVVDGNYSKVRDLVFGRIDTVVWLDLPLRTCLRRVVVRTLDRARRRELLWGTNREGLRSLVGRDSLVWWVLTTHRRRRRQNAALFADPAFAHLRRLRYTANADAERWLRST
ncbi:MAG TPA: hypothetical protein VFO05_16695 [Candidatus Limnocylindrales bacterium]|nr:hypothetical protein [Candidatus Limnocylindrales bacterium]